MASQRRGKRTKEPTDQKDEAKKPKMDEGLAGLLALQQGSKPMGLNPFAKNPFVVVPTKKNGKAKSKTQGKTKGNQEASTARKEEPIDSVRYKELETKLTRHVDVAKNFILKSFNPNSLSSEQSKEFMESLKDTTWYNDPDVWLAAMSCRLDPTYVQGSHMLKDVEFCFRSLQKISNRQASRDFYDQLDASMQREPRLIHALFARRAVTFKSMSVRAKQKPHLMSSLRAGIFPWNFLPPRQRADVDYGIAALEGDESFANVRQAVDNGTRLWQWACQHPERTKDSDWLENVPDFVRNDFGQIGRLVQVRPGAAKALADALVTRERMLDLLEQNPKALGYLPKIAFRQYPDLLTKESIGKFFAAGGDREGSSMILNHWPRQVWYDKRILRDWISCQGYSHSNIPLEMYADKSLFYHLAQTEYSDKHRYRRFFGCMDDELAKSKPFALKLCSLTDASNFFVALNGRIRRNRDVLLAACAQSSESFSRTPLAPMAYGATVLVSPTFVLSIASELAEFENFFKGILCGIRDRNSTLAMLDQGSDTGIKQRIASFLTFKTGKHFFAAAAKMGHDIFHPYHPDGSAMDAIEMEAV